MHYGIDVAATRLDDLDKRALAAVVGQGAAAAPCHVFEVGCGSGALAIALATEGARVVAVDVDDQAPVVALRLHAAGLPVEAVSYIQADIREYLRSTSTTFTLTVMQRVLHYLPYSEAAWVLCELRTRSSQLYLSVTGATSAIAAHYPPVTVPIAERWGRLDEAGQALFSITAPLCIYHETELQHLLASCGWKVTWSRVSDFGNCKLTAERW